MTGRQKAYFVAAIITGLIGGVFSRYMVHYEAGYLAHHAAKGQNMVHIVILTPIVFLVGLFMLSIAVCKIFIK